MNSTQFPKALFILLLIVIAAVSAHFFIASPNALPKFDTSYEDYPDPLPAPHSDPKMVIEVPGSIRTFDITQAGDKIAIATSKDILIYDLNSLERIHSYPISEDIAKIIFSPNGSKIALSTSDQIHHQNGPANTIVIDVDTSALLYSHQNDPDYYSFGSIAWAPDSEQIAFSIPENGLSVIDVETGLIAATLQDFAATPFDLSWSPDGSRILAAGDYGNGIRRWRLDTNQWVRLWDAHLQPASQVRWSPDGNKIATGHYGGMICIWNAGNNSCEGTVQAHYNWVGALDWSPDSTQVASASGAIRLWDASNGEMKSAFGYDEDIVYNQLQWFDPQTIAALETSYTLDIPTTIRLWDASTGDVKLAFRGWENTHGINTGGIMLVLDDIQIGSDHTELKVSLWFDSPNISIAGDWFLKMIDLQGNIYPLVDVTPLDMDRSIERVYQTVPLETGKRITLDIESFPPQQGIPTLMDFSANPGIFTIDPSTLQVGESAAVNIDVDVNGWLLRLIRVERPAPNELFFEFISEGVYTGVAVFSPMASESSTNLPENRTVSATLKFPEMPGTPIEIKVTKLFYKNLGSWELNFHVAQSMFTDLPPAQEVEPTPASAPEPKYTSQDPLFMEVQSLVVRFDQFIIQKGWVHLMSEVVSENMQPGQNYPPPYYKDEQWYEVDDEGWVLRNLTTHFDKDGIIIQQNVWVGTHSLNVTTGETMELPAYRLSLDQTLSTLDYALNNGHVVVREDTLCDDGSPCLLLKMRDGAFARHVWINADTGQFIKLQALEYAADETEIIQFTQIFLPVEWTSTPPQEVLEIFKKVIFPNP